MKCDELKPYLVGYERQYYVYDATGVEEAIAELKEFAEDACIERADNLTAIDELQAENAELKKKLEDVQATAYAESVDAGMRERSLRRELWLARTRTARYAKMFWEKNVILNEPLYFTIDYRLYEKGMKEQTLRPSEWAKVWRNVERKCRAKAEENK